MLLSFNDYTINTMKKAENKSRPNTSGDFVCDKGNIKKRGLTGHAFLSRGIAKRSNSQYAVYTAHPLFEKVKSAINTVNSGSE